MRHVKKTQNTKILTLLAIAISAVQAFDSAPLFAQTVKKWTVAEIIAKAKSGQWVEIDGAIQKDRSALALEIEFRTGDFLDDDWKLLAKVEAVHPEKNEFQIMSMSVKVTKDTEFDDGITGLNDLKPGMLVKLEGTYSKDGTFLAKEVDDRSRKLIAEPQFDGMLEIVGKVGRVDDANNAITVMGITFHITEETEGKSLLR